MSATSGPSVDGLDVDPAAAPAAGGSTLAPTTASRERGPLDDEDPFDGEEDGEPDEEDGEEDEDLSDDDLDEEFDDEDEDEDGGAAQAAPSDVSRAGFVALIGAPNAGKSTLLNRLVGAKVSIVSHKVQTTRTVVRGIAMAGSAQIVFVDTPGIFAPRRRLDRAMVDTAWAGAADADVVALLVDAAKGVSPEIEAIVDKLAEVRRPRVLILTKIDLVKRETLLALAADLNARVDFPATFMVSALTGSGTDDLLAFFARHLPEGPWLYPEDQLSDLPDRMLAAEITREKLFLRLHDELPYASTVETEQWRALKDGSIRIEQTVYVERESQRKIALGKNGQTIRAISMAAREELQALFERPVHLFLFVKVRENWADDPERYREMGLEFPRR